MTDYSKLSDFEINRSVAIAIGFHPDECDIAKRGSTSVGVEWNEDTGYAIRAFDYCNKPADAWPIIDENNITIINDHPEIRYAVNNLNAYRSGDNNCIVKSDSNGLRAAMIVFLIMKEKSK